MEVGIEIVLEARPVGVDLSRQPERRVEVQEQREVGDQALGRNSREDPQLVERHARSVTLVGEGRIGEPGADHGHASRERGVDDLADELGPGRVEEQRVRPRPDCAAVAGQDDGSELVAEPGPAWLPGHEDRGSPGSQRVRQPLGLERLARSLRSLEGDEAAARLHAPECSAGPSSLWYAPGPDMRDLTDRALDTAAQLGATYADVRVVRRRDESIAVKTGRVEGVAMGESEGFGLRVLVDGAWGFAASDRLELAEADRVGALAVRIAKASATALRRPVVLDDRPPANGTFETPIEEDPFEVPLDRKIGDLVTADRAASNVKGIVFTESTYAAMREWKTFAATDGSYTEQTITHVGAGLEANAIEGDEHQRRSYPDAGGGFQAAGYEYIRKLDLAAHAEAYAEEAVALLTAPQCEPGRRTIVLDPSQLYLQVHESCGHPTELDRVFGTEASYAGTSFLTTDKLDQGFRYGSDQITIVADATAPGGMGTFGWDDEGVAAQAVPLVKEGIFVGYLSSRETAPRIGRRSGGAMRADGWNRIPLIRMTNVNLLPVPGMSLDEIVADTDDGLYLASNRSWSIDDRRLNFQFATEVAYEIKGGKKGRLFKNPTYTGITYEFWRSCDAVGDESSFVMLGTPNCGKGEPGQTAHVGHAVPGARFRNVQVGVGKW
jgi:TldD protein